MALKIEIYREPLDRGGYTKSGQYFGTGEKLWSYYIPETEDFREKYGHIRAPNKITARKKLIADFDPNGTRGLSERASEQFKKWREPDEGGEEDDYGIWYGPGGKERENATTIEPASAGGYGGRGWAVAEYTYVIGLLDDPEDDFLKTSTFVSYDEVAKALVRDKDEISDNPGEFIRYAVEVGVHKISDRGGDEEFVGKLP